MVVFSLIFILQIHSFTFHKELLQCKEISKYQKKSLKIRQFGLDGGVMGGFHFLFHSFIFLYFLTFYLASMSEKVCIFQTPAIHSVAGMMY